MLENHHTGISPKIIVINVNFLVPGMEVARDVYSDDGRVLVSEGTIISQHTIHKLKNWQIDQLHIIAEVAVNPIINPKVQQFINNYNKSVTAVEKAFANIRETHEVSVDALEQTADIIVDEVTAAGNIIDQLYNLPSCDDYTFRHSVNVCAIAALIATWLKLPPDMVSAVSLAGLLHDIGKSGLPPHLLNKPYRLPQSDYEQYKQHTLLGLELANKNPNIAHSILSGIVQHHEREDGSGYPYGLPSEKIHPYAKIIAIADLYDEKLTINCEHPGKFSPYLSLEQLRDQIHLVDAKICIIFIDSMTNFLSGNLVALSDGRRGRVVCVNKQSPSRSMVQLPDCTVLDLSQIHNIHITYVIR
ncbi:hypothetical protein SDC9_107970 [bioreactor metagenome]|uniref:HD-GYP domain-containing protein n=1 Tax=bioreactor metagenome TaxID=1076179 RepID=A0A645B7S4_9ZZZZ